MGALMGAHFQNNLAFVSQTGNLASLYDLVLFKSVVIVYFHGY